MKTDGVAGAAASLPNAVGKRVAIVAARFYAQVADWLVDGAARAVHVCGVAEADVERFDVPGCFELPLACKQLLESGHFDACVALGAVIRGETAHFDLVAGECARGIMDVALDTGLPIGFGVVTTDTLAQAEERADPRRGDKGYHAALAALALLEVVPATPRAGFRT